MLWSGQGRQERLRGPRPRLRRPVQDGWGRQGMDLCTQGDVRALVGRKRDGEVTSTVAATRMSDHLENSSGASPVGAKPVGGAMPANAGIGLRAPHHLHVLSESPEVSWFEAHSENYFAEGGSHVACLSPIRPPHPLSLLPF